MAQVMYQLISGVVNFLQIYSYILLAYCVMSWIARPDSQIYVILRKLVEPALAPFRPISRKLIERGIPIDVSVILAFFAINILRTLLWRIYYFFI